MPVLREKPPRPDSDRKNEVVVAGQDDPIQLLGLAIKDFVVGDDFYIDQLLLATVENLLFCLVRLLASYQHCQLRNCRKISELVDKATCVEWVRDEASIVADLVYSPMQRGGQASVQPEIMSFTLRSRPRS